MRKLLSLLILLPAILLLRSENKLTPAQKASIVTKFLTEIKYNFAHTDRLPTHWDSIYMSRMPQIAGTSTDQAFYDSLKLLCASLRDGHTAVWCNNPPIEEWILPSPFSPTSKKFKERP